MTKLHNFHPSLSFGFLAVIILLAVISVDAAEVNLTEKRLFHASFDQGIDADFARGDAKGTSQQPALFEKGVKGNALVVGGETEKAAIKKDQVFQKEPGRNVYYAADGNINLQGGCMSLWLKPLDWDGGNSGFNTFVNLENNDNLFLLYKNLAAEQLSFYIESRNEEGESITETVYSMAKWKKGQWHHVAFTWTDVETNLYIDGRRVATRKIKIPFQGFDARRLSIGPGNGWAGGYMGKTLVDEVEIYNGALSEEEIILLYQKHADQAETFPGFLSLGLKSASMDGKIEPFEYAFEGQGLYDLEGFLSLHEGAHYFSYDEKNFYAAIRLPLTEEASGKMDLPRFNLKILSEAGDRYDVTIDKNGRGVLSKNGEVSAEPLPLLLTHENQELVVEMQIPFVALGLKKAPEDGDRWKINIGYTFPSGEKEVTTAGTIGGVDEYGRYLTVQFDKTAPLLRISDFYHARNNQNNTRIEVARVPEGETAVLSGNSNDTLPYGIRNLKHTLFSKGKSTPYEVPKEPFFQNLREFSIEEFGIELEKADGAVLPLYRTSFLYRDKVTPLKVSFLYTLERKQLSIAAEKVKDGMIQVRFITPDGREAWRKRSQIPMDKRYFDAIFDLDFEKLIPGDYKIYVDYIYEDGKEQEVFSQDYRIPSPDSNIFKEYVDPDANVVPAPWTSPVLKGESVVVWGREYDYGSGTPARQLTSQGHPILSRPMEILLNGAAIQPIGEIKWTLKKQEPTVVLLQKEVEYDPFTIVTDIKVHFDGYCEVSMIFKPKGSAPVIRSLSLDVPIKKEFAELLRDGLSFLGGSKTGAVKDRMTLNLTSAPFFWIGNEKAGFNWAARNLEGWHTQNHEKDLEIIPKEEDTIVRFNLVDSPDRFRGERTINFSFALTPTRPLDPAYQRVRMKRDYTLVTPWYYFGVPEYDKASKEIIEDKARNVDELYYYTGFMFASPFHPDWGFFEQEWRDLQPSTAYGDMTGDNKSGVPMFAYVSGSINSPTFRNWTLNNYADFLKKNTEKPLNPKAKNFYFDTGLALNRSRNKYQEDTSWKDGFGRKFDSLLLNEYREMTLNLYRMIKRSDPSSKIIYHQGWYRFAPLQHFTDGLLGGEGVETEVGGRGNYYDLLTPEIFRATFSPQIWGARMTFLDMTIRMLQQARPEKFAKLNVWDEEILNPLKHSYGYCLLHDVDIHDDSSATVAVEKVIWDAQDELGWDAQTRFFPYWDKMGPIKRISPENSRVMASAYTHGGNLLLVVLNDTSEKQTASFTLDLNALGVKEGLPGRDVWDSKVSVEPLNNKWSAELKPRELRMILWKSSE